MARPREFDIDVALHDAIDVFWTLGYGGASMEELIKGMGLTKGSLYKAFGDKRTLFLMALQRYIDERLTRYEVGLTRPGSPKAAIRDIMLDYVKRVTDSCDTRGCLVTNTTTEMATRDPEIARVLARMFARLEDLFAGAIARAKESGEIDASKDERALARFFVLTIQGVRVMSHMRPDPRHLASTVEVALSTLSSGPISSAAPILPTPDSPVPAN